MTRRIPEFCLDDAGSYVVDMTRSGNWLAYCTARLDIDEGSGSGTAFFFSVGAQAKDRVDYLVTNKHVIRAASKVSTTLHIDPPRDRNHFRPGGVAELDIPNPESEFLMHPDPEVDLCAIAVSRCKELAGGQLDKLFYSPITSHALLTDDDYRRLYAVLRVVMIGYPIGLWDQVHNLPLLRSGHTATHPAVSFEREPHSLVDIAVFPGSSGSPVLFWEDRYFGSAPKLLGVLFAGCQFEAGLGLVRRAVPTTTELQTAGDWTNLGWVVRARELLFLQEFQ